MNSSLLHFYIFKKQSDLTLQEIISKYEILCYYTSFSQKNIDYNLLRQQYVNELSLIDFDKIVNDCNKTKQDTKDNQAKIKNLQITIDNTKNSITTEYNDTLNELNKEAVVNFEKQLVIIELEAVALFDKYYAEVDSIKDYDIKHKFINSMPQEYASDDFEEILVWDTDDFEKPSQDDINDYLNDYNLFLLEGIKLNKIQELTQTYNANKYLVYINNINTNYKSEEVLNIYNNRQVSEINNKNYLVYRLPSLNKSLKFEATDNNLLLVEGIKDLLNASLTTEYKNAYYNNNYDKYWNLINNSQDKEEIDNIVIKIQTIDLTIPLEYFT